MTAKEMIMTRMTNVLKGQAMFVREDDTISVQDKCTQMDVILDLMRFLDNYDVYVQILYRLFEQKRQKGKYQDNEER